MKAQEIAIRPLDDEAAIAAVIRHPDVWARSSDDHAGRPEDFAWPAAPDRRALGAYLGDELIGLFVIVAHLATLWEVHTAILPAHRGVEAEAAARELLRLVFADDSPCARLYTLVPSTNRAATIFALRCGFARSGSFAACFRKDGILHDMTILSISRG